MIPTKITEENKRLAVAKIYADSIEGKCFVHLLYLAETASKRFREKRDPWLIIEMVELWLKLCGVSRTEANNILTIVKRNISLRNSVV